MIGTNDRVSRHEAMVFGVLWDNRHQWLTSHDVAGPIQISGRTARKHIARLVRLGLAEKVNLFPSPKYRLVTATEQQHTEHVARLRQAVEMFDKPQGEHNANSTRE